MGIPQRTYDLVWLASLGASPTEGVGIAPLNETTGHGRLSVMVIPNTVRWAAIAWAGAVAAGAIESILAFARAADAGPLVPSIWAGIGLRFVIYTLATILIVTFWRGRRWARAALTVLLTVIGLASLV